MTEEDRPQEQSATQQGEWGERAGKAATAPVEPVANLVSTQPPVEAPAPAAAAPEVQPQPPVQAPSDSN
jgi:hypothetical protein